MINWSFISAYNVLKTAFTLIPSWMLMVAAIMATVGIIMTLYAVWIRALYVYRCITKHRKAIQETLNESIRAVLVIDDSRNFVKFEITDLETGKVYHAGVKDGHWNAWREDSNVQVKVNPK